MFLRAVKKPLKIIRLETFTGQRNIERADKWRTRRCVLCVDRCLEHPA
jgi:hypothetical protein